MANIIKIKRGLEANLPSLAIGEIAYTTNTNKLFIGVNTGTIEAPVIQNVLINDLPVIADQTEAEEGTINTKVMTPLRTAQAIAAQVGALLTSGGYATTTELANAIASIGGDGLVFDNNLKIYNLDYADKTEAEAGTNTVKVMTPSTTKDAILELSPPPIIASQQEAEAGEATDKFMTPQRTKQAIEALSPGVTVDDEAPTNPKEGDLWWDSSDGTLYIYFDNDGNPIWVEITFGELSLSDIQDVVLTNPQDGESLVYDDGVWINSQVSGVQNIDAGSSTTVFSVADINIDGGNA